MLRSILLLIFVIVVASLLYYNRKRILETLGLKKGAYGGGGARYTISQITDIEGSLPYLSDIVKLDPMLKGTWTPNNNGEHELTEMDFAKYDSEHYVVITGDSVDQGCCDRKVVNILTNFKNKYPTRVRLIGGNRDMNKLRYLNELKNPDDIKSSSISDTEIKRIDNNFWWVAPKDKLAVTAADLTTKKGYDIWVPILKHILKHTMGSPNSFKNAKQELIAFNKGAPASDTDVYKYYYNSVNGPDPWMLNYIKLCKPMDYIYDNIFMHGALDDETLWHMPDFTVENHNNNLRSWIDSYNNMHFTQINNLMNAIGKGVESHIRNQIDVLGNPGLKKHAAHMGYKDSTTRKFNDGVSNHPTTNNWMQNGNNTPPQPGVDRIFRENKITGVFTGHKPHVKRPSIISMGGYLIVIADNSYSDGSPAARKSYHSVNITNNVVSIQSQTFTNGVADPLLTYAVRKSGSGSWHEHVIGKPFAINGDAIKQMSTQLCYECKNCTDGVCKKYESAYWGKAYDAKTDEYILVNVQGFRVNSTRIPASKFKNS